MFSYRLKILIIITLTTLLLTPTAFASPPLDTKQAELKNVTAQIQANQNQQHETEQRQAQILQDIRLNDQKITDLQKALGNLQLELDKTTAERQATEIKINNLQKQLDVSQQELKMAKEKLQKTRATYNKRLIEAYKGAKGDEPNLIVLLVSSRSFEDLVKRSALLNIIAKTDGKLVSDMEKLTKKISDKVAQINAEKESIDQHRVSLLDQENRIKSIKDNATIKQKLFKGELGKQKELLAKAQEEKIQLEEIEAQLVATSRMIREQISVIQQQERNAKKARNVAIGATDQIPDTSVAPVFNPTDVTLLLSHISAKGFMHPVVGEITSSFGYRFHPILKVVRLHSGIDFGVQLGTPVFAAKSGTVMIAGVMGGYGNVIAIDHGNGISTLYAHNSSLVVKVGQHVDQGQVISYSGTSGLSTGPHLHFEVRENGTPVDPMNYL